MDCPPLAIPVRSRTGRTRNSRRQSWKRTHPNEPRVVSTVVLFALIVSACQVTEKASEQTPSTSERPRITADGNKVADKILAETSDLQVADKWYMDVYPALRTKYGMPVTRALYDLWRESYFRDSVMPVAMKYGYNTAVFHDAFFKATQRQPSN